MGRRIIDQLRSLYPKERWQYNGAIVGWVSDGGVLVSISLVRDGEQFKIEYHRSDTKELVPIRR